MQKLLKSTKIATASNCCKGHRAARSRYTARLP